MEENGNSNKYSLEDFRNGSPFQRTVLRDIEEHLKNPLDETTEEQRQYDRGGEEQGPYRLYFSDFRKATLARIVPANHHGDGRWEILDEKFGTYETDIEKDTFEIVVTRNYLVARGDIIVYLHSSLSWWKAITAYDHWHRPMGHIYTDNYGPDDVRMVLPLSDIRPYGGQGGPLILSKAKFLGRKEKMYHWNCEPLQDRTRYDIRWLKDG